MSTSRPGTRATIVRAAGASVTVVGGTLVIGGTPVHGLSVEVDTLADTVNGGDGVTSLREALADVAAAGPGPHTITFEAGLSGTIDLTGGTLDVPDRDLSIVGPGTAVLTLTNATGDILYLYQGTQTRSISGLTLGGADGAGVAMYNVRSVELDDVVVDSNAYSGVEIAGRADLVITDSTISNNGYAGVFADYSKGGSLVLDGTTVSGNTSDGLSLYVGSSVDIRGSVVSGNSGRGMYAIDIGAVTITDSTISNNSEGGVALGDGGSVTVRRASITGNGNTGARGGGLRVYSILTDALIEDSTISGNSAASGGGLYVDESDITIRQSTISGNTAAVRGGGIAGVANGTETTLTVDRSTISGNTSLYDGGVYLRDATATIVSSTIAENEANYGGSGVGATGADIVIEHSTISGNDTTGSAVGLDMIDGGLRLDHTILAGNTYDDFVDSTIGAPPSPAAHSLIGAASLAEITGTGNIGTADPLLGALADNGGPTETLLPQAGSPAIDAGDPAIVGAPATDQRGATPRALNTIDIGAVETGAVVSATPFVVSTDPERFIDTRPGQSGVVAGGLSGIGRRGAGTTTTLQVGGIGSVPADAQAVVVNMTAIQASGVGFLTVYACDDDQPLASSLNYTAGVNLGNEIIAGLSASGELCIFTSEEIHLTADVVGYVPNGSSYTPVVPARLLDTRPGQKTIDNQFAGGGKRPAGGELTLKVGGRGGVPNDAGAVIVNVTSIAADGVGFVTTHPCLADRPLSASLNYVAGVNRGNEIVAALSDDGEICLYTSERTHMSVDVVGWLPKNAPYTPVDPSRYLDTRPGEKTFDGQNAGEGKRAAGTELRLEIGGRGDVPADAKGVVINLAAIAGEDVGFVTVYDCAGAPPTASSLNFIAGVNGSNEIIAGLNDDGELCLFVSTRVHLAVDVVGFTPV